MKVFALLVVLVAVVGCDSTRPNSVLPAGQFTVVSAGSSHACALDTLGRAWCWGSNGEGALGVPRVPCTVSTTCLGRATLVSPEIRLTTISAGFDYTCGLKSDGTAYCWGSNFVNKLAAANPPTTNCDFTLCSDTPLPAAVGFTFSQLGAGVFTTCGITTTSVGKCWGANTGYVASASTSFATPVSVVLQPTGDSTWESLGRAWDNNDCGVTPDHHAACWGGNEAGQLGVGGTPPASSTSGRPTVVATTTPLHGVTVGALFACALDAAGAAYCWGISTDSSLGVGLEPGGVACTPNAHPVTCYPSATKVGGGFHFSSLSAGGGHVCGLTLEDEARCWGLNSSSEIGTGLITSQATYVAYPYLVYGGLHFTAISAGDTFTCGLGTDKNAWCWGSNIRGQLGQDPRDTVTTTFPIQKSGIPIRIVAKTP